MAVMLILLLDCTCARADAGAIIVGFEFYLGHFTALVVVVGAWILFWNQSWKVRFVVFAYAFFSCILSMAVLSLLHPSSEFKSDGKQLWFFVIGGFAGPVITAIALRMYLGRQDKQPDYEDDDV